MIFVHISDTHNYHKQVAVPPGDCLIVSGDFTSVGHVQEITAFNAWLGTLPHKYKILVAGNHDKLFETNPSLARSLITNAIYLQDEEVTIEGIRIYGSPWQIEFCNWAFNLSAGPPLKVKWDMISEGTDILVTHSPPKGVLDYVERYDRASGKHSLESLGCHELLLAVKRIKPRFHLFGHIHYSHGKIEIDGTTYMNSAICNEEYSPDQPPQVFEFTKQ